jgi:hypothetical protein
MKQRESSRHLPRPLWEKITPPRCYRMHGQAAPTWNAILVCQRGGAMLSGAKPVGRPSMLFMFFRAQYFRRLSTPRAVQ